MEPRIVLLIRSKRNPTWWQLVATDAVRTLSEYLLSHSQADSSLVIWCMVVTCNGRQSISQDVDEQLAHAIYCDLVIGAHAVRLENNPYWVLGHLRGCVEYGHAISSNFFRLLRLQFHRHHALEDQTLAPSRRACFVFVVPGPFHQLCLRPAPTNLQGAAHPRALRRRASAMLLLLAPTILRSGLFK